jgi:hypothetical protein
MARLSQSIHLGALSLYNGQRGLQVDEALGVLAAFRERFCFTQDGQRLNALSI